METTRAGMRAFPPETTVAVLTTEPLDRFLDYLAPEGGVSVGDFVRVPLGPRQVLGVVWGPGSGGYDRAKLRTVSARLDVQPMAGEMRTFLERAAEYTLSPLSQMLRLATRAPDLGGAPSTRTLFTIGPEAPDRLTPARARVLDALEAADGPLAPGDLAERAGVSSGVLKGLEASGSLVRVTAPRTPPYARLDPDGAGPDLSPAQTAAARALREAVRARAYGTTLLKGVTGSGKTEVYLEAVAEALHLGRQALVLLPEIALTGAFLDRVEARFGARPGEWHSGVTEARRRHLWRATAKGEVQLVVGARSSLYLPFTDLGLIVVDEEHDAAYKQEEGVLYHARDMAVLRASLTSAAVVLASATPSLESFVNARIGKYARLDLPERYGTAELPEMRAVDMTRDAPPRGRWVSPTLERATAARIDAGEQTLWFLNRRGYAPLTQCRACGHQIGCSACDARLVEHRFRRRLVCHQCGAEHPIPTTCPACGASDTLTALGPGVERLAEEAATLFPEARVEILSSDQAESPTALRTRIEGIAAGGADIVIGTQIVAKGHNFPLLTLVGCIDADLGLHGAELRAAERTFQLIRQVAGRAGRTGRRGLALIQTAEPAHPVMAAILAGEEEAFWSSEAARRDAAGAPPYGRMAGVIVSGPDEAAVTETARALARTAGPLAGIGAELFGPAPAPIARIRGRHRHRLLVKAPKTAPLQPTLAAWRDALRPPSRTRITIDIDPQSFF